MAQELHTKDLPIKAKVLAFLKELGIVLGAFLLLNNFVIASFLVPTGSMENEVLTGDLLFVNKFIFGVITYCSNLKSKSFINFCWITLSLSDIHVSKI